MLNPVISCVIYFVEMLIALLFFSGISERRRSSRLCWLVGILLYESGAVVNLIFANSIVVNAATFTLINLGFALFCFRIRPLPAFFYSAMLTVLSAALEFFTIFIGITICLFLVAHLVSSRREHQLTAGYLSRRQMIGVISQHMRYILRVAVDTGAILILLKLGKLRRIFQRIASILTDGPGDIAWAVIVPLKGKANML